jgi:NAD(P)H-dependent flavin oxidoreductase YrpB (nitropropane dioxygenase family)
MSERRFRRTPGGVSSLGLHGVWCPKYRRRILGGRSAWTDAWEAEAGGPKPLPMPLQLVLSENVLRRIDTLAENGNKGAQDLATYWVGQGVGLLNKVRPAREVVREMIEDYREAVERLSGSLED